jgi:hypothetical protein
MQGMLPLKKTGKQNCMLSAALRSWTMLRHDLDDEHFVLGGKSDGRSPSPLPKLRTHCCTHCCFETGAPRKSETPGSETAKRINPEESQGLRAAGKEV